MDRVYLALSLGLCVALGVMAGFMLRGPVHRYIEMRKDQRELDALFAATSRQRELQRIQEMRQLLRSFRDAATGLVEELADGGGRWASFYLTRDLLREVLAQASPGIVMPARQMCFVCQRMLNDGFSDELEVRFSQAVARFESACQDELLGDLDMPVAPATASLEAESEHGHEAHEPAQRRYFSVSREESR